MKLSRFGSLVGATALLAGLAVVNFPARSDAYSNTFDTPGQIENITIPAGVSEITFELRGGNGQAGGGECGTDGGLGGQVSGTLSVAAGDVITIVVGAHGEDAQYGGDGGVTGGGHGGDASYIYLNGDDNSDIIAAAGAGGGGGGGPANANCTMYGGAGGSGNNHGMMSNGGQGNDEEFAIPGGARGTNSSTGMGGLIMPSSVGENGFGLEGGDGGDTESGPYGGGGGGGAGYYGGGGGAGFLNVGGGGGAGASYLSESTTGGTIQLGNVFEDPYVVLNYTDPEETTSTHGTLPKPNNGDGNGDGVEDYHQSNVHTILTNLTPETWVTFVHPEGCEFGGGFISGEDGFAADDASYQYPANFFGFEIACPQPTVTVELFFHNVPGTAKDYIPRKYLSYSQSYVTLEGASVQDVTIGGKNVVKVTYSLTDGGMYDNDQTVNGVIVDPASIAYSPVTGTLPATGGNNLAPHLITVAVLLLGGVTALAAVRRRKVGLL